PPLAAQHASGDSPARRKLASLAGFGEGSRALDEQGSKEVLRLFGVRTPREKFVAGRSAERVVDAAADLTFPLVAKPVRARVAHKSDAGLVLLNLSDAASLRAAADTLLARSAAIGVEPDGILVAEQLTGGVEVVVGLHRDPEIGPVVMFGAGGIYL